MLLPSYTIGNEVYTQLLELLRLKQTCTRQLNTSYFYLKN